MYSRADFRRAAELINTHKLKVLPLATDVFSANDAAKAYNCPDLPDSTAMKVMVRFDA